MASGIPEDVRRFVVEHFDSLEQLEVLLLLRRVPDEWTPEATADELRTTPASAAKRLDRLAKQGLVQRAAGTFRYLPRDGHRPIVDRLAWLYPEYRVAITSLIFERPPPHLQRFADAFRLRSDSDG